MAEELRNRMDGVRVIVKRFRRAGEDRAADENKKQKYYLSFLSTKDFTLQNCELPFLSDGPELYASSCHDWLCFYNRRSYIVYNITTKEVRTLPPRKLDDPSHDAFLNGTGIGYDYTSGDYKVVRNFTEDYVDLRYHSELYSLRNDTCEQIPDPDSPFVNCGSESIFIGGTYYWLAMISPKLKREAKLKHNLAAPYSCSNCGFDVLSFDFATQTYSAMPLPPDTLMDPHHYLVDCAGSLGIITYSKRKHSERQRSSVSKKKGRFYELWVWKETSWTRLYEATLHHVVKPLCLMDGRISFFEGKPHDMLCDLVIYNWATKEMKRLDICDKPGRMQVFHHVATGIQLPLDANGTDEVEQSGKTRAKAKTKTKAILRDRDEAKSIGEEREFHQGLEGGSLEEIPSKR